MISELETLLPSFSDVNHIRCFLHVNNLVARTLVRQIDAPKRITGEDIDEENEALIELAGDMEFEERATRERLLEETRDDLSSEDDDVTGWINEMAALSRAERNILENTTRPVKMVLVKVSRQNQTSIIQYSLYCRFGNWLSRSLIQQHSFFHHGEHMWRKKA